MSSPELGQMAGCLRAVLDALAPPSPMYCLIGALAVNAWGRVRSTQDIDLLVLSQGTNRERLVKALAAHGFHPDAAWVAHNPLAQDRVLRLGHPSYAGIPLDLIFSSDPHEESLLSRTRVMGFLSLSVPVCSPEDLILLKLKAGRPHDFEDALGIVKNPHLQLDLAYMWNWVDRLGLCGELRYVLEAAAPPK